MAMMPMMAAKIEMVRMEMVWLMLGLLRVQDCRERGVGFMVLVIRRCMPGSLVTGVAASRLKAEMAMANVMLSTVAMRADTAVIR